MAIRKRKSDLPEYGIKIRLYPTLVQQAKLRQFFGNDRFLWNQLVSLYQERYKNNKKSKLLTEFDLNNLLPALKNEYPFLKASDSSSFQIVTKNISDAWEAFFAGTRRKPRFHSKHSAKQSYTCKSSGIRIMGKRNMFLGGTSVINRLTSVFALLFSLLGRISKKAGLASVKPDCKNKLVVLRSCRLCVSTSL